VSPFLKNEEFIVPEQRTDGTYDFSDMPAGLFALAAAGVSQIELDPDIYLLTVFKVERGLKLYYQRLPSRPN
jgi:hypothetical protein